MNAKSSAILLTPAGSAAIAVIRLSGPLAPAFVTNHLSKPVRRGKCVHAILTDTDGSVIDDPVVTIGTRGQIDLNVHGGPWVVRSVLALAECDGFDVSGHMSDVAALEAVDAETPLEAEILRHLPLARTDLAMERLLSQMEAWREWRSRLDQQVGVERWAMELTEMREDQSLTRLLHPPRVAVVGIPNAGKSTLANSLFASERSITADVPGTTRDWVGELANVDGLAVMLLDTPGIRVTDDSIETASIERAAIEIEGADLIILVLDATQPLVGEQAALVDQFPQAIRAINKSDRAGLWPCASLVAIPTIATTGEGIDSLRLAVQTQFGLHARPALAARWWTTQQRRELAFAASNPTELMNWIDRQLMPFETVEPHGFAARI